MINPMIKYDFKHAETTYKRLILPAGLHRITLGKPVVLRRMISPHSFEVKFNT
jgi:hypothetical protein